jgi:hypothetical protein
MAPIVTTFMSTDLYVSDRKLFEEFVAFELNPAACGALGDDPVSWLRSAGGGSSPLRINRRDMSTARGRKALLWERRLSLPIRIGKGCKSDAMTLQSSGDSDNDDDAYLTDQHIEKICSFLPREGVFGFKHVQYPSSDTDDPGGVWFWVYDHGTTAARGSRIWSGKEIATGRFRAPTLTEFMRYYRRTGSLRLLVREL